MNSLLGKLAFSEENRLKNPIRWGMIGGGRGSEIGYAHRNAATRDGGFVLTAGCLDLDLKRGLEFGKNIGLSQDRCYPDFQALLEAEVRRDDGIQAITIATPNSSHYEIAAAALDAGLHVICEKPVTITSDEAADLKKRAAAGKRMLAVMYGYSGYPMVHQAREMVCRGELGEIRVVNTQFAHGYGSAADENGYIWRLDPEIVGPTFVLADVGTHAFYLVELITGLQVANLCCSRQSFVETRTPLEDNAHVLLNFEGGAVGSLWASAVNAGSTHQQKIRIVGEKASLEWWDEHPNQLRLEVQGQPVQILDRGFPYLHNDTPEVACSRVGSGHPEGFFDSWSNLYARFAVVIGLLESGEKFSNKDVWYPDIDAGISGVRFLEACVRSSDAKSAWVSM